MASWSRYGTRSSMARLFGQITPVGLPRCDRACACSRNRVAEISTAPSPGMSASSAIRTKLSTAILPSLTSGINALPERFDTQSLDGVHEKFVGTFAKRQIGFDD